MSDSKCIVKYTELAGKPIVDVYPSKLLEKYGLTIEDIVDVKA
jgi:hypothetical protein